MKNVYSLKTIRVKEADFPYNGNAIKSPEDLAEFAKSLNDSDIEKFVVVFVNSAHRVIGIYHTSGTIDQAAVYPREIMKHAILTSAASMFLIHNHPSGNTEPSEQDVFLTRKIKEAADLFNIRVLDHLILGDGFASFKERGLL